MATDDARKAAPPASRRRYERIPMQKCSIEIFRPGFLGFGQRKLKSTSIGLDLSEVGMRFATAEPLDIGEKLRIVAKLDVFRDVVEGACAVVWCAANARVAGEFMVGVEWTSLAEGHYSKIQQIRKLVRSKEFQAKLQTKSRVEREKKDDNPELEYKSPPTY